MNTYRFRLMAMGTAALALSGCDAVKDAIDAAGITVNVVGTLNVDGDEPEGRSVVLYTPTDNPDAFDDSVCTIEGVEVDLLYCTCCKVAVLPCCKAGVQVSKEVLEANMLRLAAAEFSCPGRGSVGRGRSRQRVEEVVVGRAFGGGPFPFGPASGISRYTATGSRPCARRCGRT